jgi:hypothetical protein
MRHATAERLLAAAKAVSGRQLKNAAQQLKKGIATSKSHPPPH